MKARVKATGALLIVRPYDGSNFDWICDMGGENGTLWKTEQLQFINDFRPDYWEKLKHQYAGKFLQGMIIGKPFTRDYVEDAYNYATALVNRLKEDSQCKE